MKLSNEMIEALYFYMFNKEKLHVEKDRASIRKMFEVFKPLINSRSDEWREFWQRYKNND